MCELLITATQKRTVPSLDQAGLRYVERGADLSSRLRSGRQRTIESSSAFDSGRKALGRPSGAAPGSQTNSDGPRRVVKAENVYPLSPRKNEVVRTQEASCCGWVFSGRVGV